MALQQANEAVPPPPDEAVAVGGVVRSARNSLRPEGTPPGRFVLLLFAVVAALLAGAAVGLTAAHGSGRLVDLFLFGSGVLLGYAAGLRIAPLVAVALAATYVVLEGHYERLDGDHAGSVVAFVIVFVLGVLAAGALADVFAAWNRRRAGAGTDGGPETESPPISPPSGPLPEGEGVDPLLAQEIRRHGALSLLLARPHELERLGLEHDREAARAVLERVEEIVGEHASGREVLHREGLFDLWIVLPRTSLEVARKTAERVRLAAAEVSVPLTGGDSIECSLSVGIASCPIDGRSPERLRRAALRALETAARLGGNRTVLHSLPPGAPSGWGIEREPQVDSGSAA